MTTHVVIAQARADQVTAHREAAEAELLAAMRTVEPAFAGTVACMTDRRWESRLEGLRPCWELRRAHSAWRRAVRAEAKAHSAASRAQHDVKAASGFATAPSLSRR
jgi:hypothetical protein